MSRILVPATPAGSDLTYSARDVTEDQGILSSIQVDYVAGATVSNRTITMTLTDKQGNEVGKFASTFDQTANTTVSYLFGNTGAPCISGNNAVVNIPMQDLFLEGGDLITLEIVESDDNYENAVFSVVGGPQSAR